jgi:hypothetical protein
MAAAEWLQVWKVNPHGSHLRRIFAAPAKALLDSVLRPTVVIQLHTGRMALAAYLGTLGAVESNTVPLRIGDGR